MNNFISLFQSILSSVATFLSSEPMIWFVGLLVLAFAIGTVARLIHISR